MSGSTPSPASLLREARALTRRQSRALGLAVALLGGLVAATAVALPAIAAVLVGAMVMLVLAGLIQLRRRLAQEVATIRARLVQDAERAARESQAVQRQLADLQDRLQFLQRQLLAVVETERLASADRHAALMATVDQVAGAGKPAGNSGDRRRAPSQRQG